VVRIILSGQSDKSMVMKTVMTAHQYLAKPCNDVTLKACLERARLLRDMMRDESLRGVVSQIDTLPSLPALYLEIMKELEKEYASIRTIGNIISRDIGMTAKVLQLVNSAFFGFRRHIASPAEAAELLGLETIKVLVLSVEIFSQVDQKKIRGFSVERLWDHSMTTGTYARTIAAKEKLGQALVEDTFMAGVLHDAGKLVLAANLPDRYQEVLTRARNNGSSLREAERQILGVTHAEVGGYLLALWGLPQEITEAISFHHEPSQQPAREFGCLTAVHVANDLAHEALEPEAASGLDMAYLSDLQLEHRLPHWQAACQEAIREGGEDDV
jgi:HD-like signal output (HDOD) protein